VRKLQEWLGFNRCPTSIDADFGDGTGRALKDFRQARQLPQTGALDATTWSSLVEPMRHSPGDWCHTGFAVAGSGTTFSTIEGNTNDDGSSNGFEVCARSRSVKDKEFILLT
jgi:hypothetical protein